MSDTSSSLTLVVMAAGMGSRYGGLKQIDPVGPGGEVVLDYSVYDAIQAGFDHVVFVIRRDIEQDFKEAVGAHFEGRLRVSYVFQELTQVPEGFSVPEGRTKPWGTTHAALAAAGAVDSPFCIINADDFYGRESFVRAAAWLREHRDTENHYLLLGFILANTLSDHGGVSRGVCVVDDQGRLAEIEECHEIQRVAGGVQIRRAGGMTLGSGQETVSMNMWGFTPGVFAHFRRDFATFLSGLDNPLKGECLIPAAVHHLIVDGAAVVDVRQSPAQWMGVTYPKDKPVVVASIRTLIQAGDYPERLWA